MSVANLHALYAEADRDDIAEGRRAYGRYNAVLRSFAQGLRVAAIPIERRNTIPILSYVLIDSHDETATLRATNLDQQLTVEVPTVNGSRVRAAFAEPLALATLILAGNGDTVTLDTDSKPGKALISSGQMSGELGTLPAEDHPQIAISEASAFDAELGTAALDTLFRVARAMSTEETRYYLNGVFLHHVEGWTWKLAATDGHRLYVATLELPGATFDDRTSIQSGAIIPRHAISMMRRLRPHMGTDAIRVRITGALTSNAQSADLGELPPTALSVFRLNCTVHGYPVELLSKTIDGTFPDYKRVIPEYGEGAPSILFKRADLARALHGITAGTSDKSRAVKLTFDPKGAGSLVVSAKWIDMGFEGKITIPATVKCKAAFEIGYNGKYLADLLEATGGEELAITTADAASPGSMVDPCASDFRAVLMPMRV